MISEKPAAKHHPVDPGSAPPSRWRWFWEAENLLISLALATLMLLPIIEIVGRKVFHGGVSGAAAFEQHLVLIIGLLGASSTALVRLLTRPALAWQRKAR